MTESNNTSRTSIALQWEPIWSNGKIVGASARVGMLELVVDIVPSVSPNGGDITLQFKNPELRDHTWKNIVAQP
jgi:hypothetical protein